MTSMDFHEILPLDQFKSESKEFLSYFYVKFLVNISCQPYTYMYHIKKLACVFLMPAFYRSLSITFFS